MLNSSYISDKDNLVMLKAPTRFSALAGSLPFGSPKKKLKQATENPKINRIKLSRIATRAIIATI